MLNRIVLGTVRRIMHNEQIHIKFGSELHKILLHNAMRAGVGTTAITQDDYGVRSGILLSEMLVPYTLDVVAYELRSVVAGAYRIGNRHFHKDFSLMKPIHEEHYVLLWSSSYCFRILSIVRIEILSFL